MWTRRDVLRTLTLPAVGGFSTMAGEGNYNEIFTEGWKPTLAEWRVPEAPGLGIDFSPSFLKDHTIPGL